MLWRQMVIKSDNDPRLYEAVDSGEASAQIFFADFTKRFDLIDHSILMQALANLKLSSSCAPSLHRSWQTGGRQLESEELCQY